MIRLLYANEFISFITFALPTDDDGAQDYDSNETSRQQKVYYAILNESEMNAIVPQYHIRVLRALNKRNKFNWFAYGCMSE